MRPKEPPEQIKRRVVHGGLLLYVLIMTAAMWLVGRFDAAVTVCLLCGVILAGVAVWWREYRQCR